MKYLFLLFIFTACASSPKICPSATEEPVSFCRAEIACPADKMALFFGGFSASKNNGRNLAQEQIEECRRQNLIAQKRNAEFKSGSKSSETNCESKVVGDKIFTHCD